MRNCHIFPPQWMTDGELERRKNILTQFLYYFVISYSVNAFKKIPCIFEVSTLSGELRSAVSFPCDDDQHFLTLHTVLRLDFQRKSSLRITSHGWILPYEFRSSCTLTSFASILTRWVGTINWQGQLAVFMEPWFIVATLSVQMPLLGTQYLHKHRELRLAHLALSVMTMGYTWQEGENNTVEVSLCVSDFSLILVTLIYFSSGFETSIILLLDAAT